MWNKMKRVHLEEFGSTPTQIDTKPIWKDIVSSSPANWKQMKERAWRKYQNVSSTKRHGRVEKNKNWRKINEMKAYKESAPREMNG